MPSTEALGPTAVGRVRQSSIASDGDFQPGLVAKGLRSSLVPNPRNERNPALAGLLCHRAGRTRTFNPRFWSTGRGLLSASFRSAASAFLLHSGDVGHGRLVD